MSDDAVPRDGIKIASLHFGADISNVMEFGCAVPFRIPTVTGFENQDLSSRLRTKVISPSGNRYQRKLDWCSRGPDRTL
jgi:hypothetical protein